MPDSEIRRAAEAAPDEPAPRPTPLRRGRLAALRDELRSRVLTYVAVVAFAAIGPVLAHMIFPEAPLALVVFGGVALGVFFAFSALSDKLLE